MQNLLEKYRWQKRLKLEGNIYHKTQVELAFNSNHIEGSRLTEEQTRQIFETRTVDGPANVNDIQEAANHFRSFDFMLDTADQPLSAELIREYHRILKTLAGAFRMISRRDSCRCWVDPWTALRSDGVHASKFGNN